MGSTTAVYARIDTDLKDRAEGILSRLGISPSSAIQMLYSQVVLTGGLPFTPRVPARRPLGMDPITEDDLVAAVKKAIESVEAGKGVPVDEVEHVLAAEYSI